MTAETMQLVQAGAWVFGMLTIAFIVSAFIIRIAENLLAGRKDE